MILAASNGHLEIVEILLARNVNIEAKNNVGGLIYVAIHLSGIRKATLP